MPHVHPEPLVPLAARLRSGDLDPADYLDELERRFAEREGDVRAFVPEKGRFERLRREARELAARWPDPAGRPPLYGVPVGVKDIFHADGFATGAGSRLPPEALAGPEAAAVEALRRAGALVAGKTASTEFAYYAPGPTRNPHRLTHTPGGSSSGSAAAVAAGLVPLAIGTQTIGSILRPASFCGVTGFKPSFRRISRQGLIPLAPSLDHVGPFTAEVRGAELAAAVLCRVWREMRRLPRPRLGVPEGPYLERASAAGRACFEGVCRRLEAAGYEVVAVPAMADFEEIEARHHRVVAAEAARVHEGWFDRFGELYHPKTAELVERGRGVSDDELVRLRTGRDRLRRELTAAMDPPGLDLWLSPAAPGPAPEGLDSTGDPVMNLPWTHAGLPTLAIPAGQDDSGLPMGLQVAARLTADEALMLWGRGLEEALA